MAQALLEKFKAARRAGVPLLVINTPDPQATMKLIFDEFGVSREKSKGVPARAAVPFVQWDIVRTALGQNVEGNAMLANLVGGSVDESGKISQEALAQIQQESASPAGVLEFAAKFSSGTILFFLNAHRFLDNVAVAQATWNLRDQFKADKRMVVFLAPSVTLPAELKSDMVVLDEPLPTDKELEQIIVRTYKSANVAAPENGLLLKSVDAIAGLAAFSAETSAAMAMTPTGLDLETLGAQKRSQVSGIPGASIWGGKEKFSDIVGVANVKNFLGKLLGNGRERIREIFFMDELEKMVAGSGDTSGVSQAMNEQFLAWTQNARVLGLIEIGVPGAGKSQTAKAAAGEFDIPCFMASLSAVKGSLVGESERNVKQLFKTADAIAAGGRILMIATCNQIGALTPEMQARFRLGTFFFDYPDAEENKALWAFYRKRFSIADTDIPESTNWVGREIESCCELAYLLDVPLKQAANKIVPVCKAQATKIRQLKAECSGRFISASYDGIYKFDDAAPVASALNPGGRALSFDA